MYIPPNGPSLTAAQAAELDDSYFRSQPFGYFSSRISTLIASPQANEDRSSSLIEAEFAAALGQASMVDLLTFDDSDRQLQIATDAFALRHHAAESLVRLYHGLTVGLANQGPVKCLWAAVADGPPRIIDLVNQSKAHFGTPESQENFWTLVLPTAMAAQIGQDTRQVNKALNVMGNWLQHAMHLLSRTDIDVNAANNKVKHGLAVRARGDFLLALTSQEALNPNGDLQLEALTDSETINIFDGPTLDYLSRPPKQPGMNKQGLEVSSLKLVPSTLLAETWLMSVAHAAMFHVAASQYFAGRPASIQPYPQLPLSPTPEELLGETVVGMRQPLTDPPGGGSSDRTTGLAFRSGFVPLEVTFIGTRKVVSDGSGSST